MSDYAVWVSAIELVAIIALSVFLFKSRSGGGSAERVAELQRDIEKLTQNFTQQIQSQTGSLVETISRIREESKTAIGQSFTETRKNLDESLSLGRKELDRKLDDTQKIVSQKLEQLIKETADIRTASTSMLEVGKDIRQLSDILEGSKSRGSFGEFQLELLLKQVIPPDRYKIQYAVGDGIVDAALLLEERVLCIDSKFPFANLKKYYESQNDTGRDEKLLKLFYSDVKKRAKEINKTYIVPQVTLEFAVMFVPSESVFSEIIGNVDLHNSLLDMHIVPASPNFLYVYFQALAIGFRGMAVEARASEILRVISELKIGFEKFQSNFRLIGTHMERAQKQFAESEKQAGKIENTLENLQMGEVKELPEKPADQA